MTGNNAASTPPNNGGGRGWPEDPTDPTTQMMPPAGGGYGSYQESTWQEYPQQQFPQQQYSQQAWPRQGGQQGPGGGYPQQGGEEKKGFPTRLLIAVVTLIVILLLALAGTVGYMMLRSNSTQESPGASTQAEPEVATVTATEQAPTTAAQAPAQDNRRVLGPPSWASAVDTGYTAGSYKNTYKSGPTSDSFARAVRSTFVQNYTRTGATNATLEVHSSVTGRNYTMHCSDESSYVHCSGGDNANVYLY